jgi:hypothetical protein
MCVVVSGVAGLALARLHPPQHALDAGQQLARIERFRDVVVGADLEADDSVDDITRRGDHDDADVVALAQVTRECQAVFARHADVEQDQVGQIALDLSAHLGAVGGGPHGVAVAAEVLQQHGPNARVVIDDEHAGSAVHGLRSSWVEVISIQNDNTRYVARRVPITGASDTACTFPSITPERH